MDPLTSAASQVFGMTAKQLTSSPPTVSSAAGRADSTSGVTFSTGSFNIAAPSFSMLFFVAAVIGAALFFILKAHK